MLEKSKQLRDLRNSTNFPLSICHRALEENNWDTELAQKYLLEVAVPKMVEKVKHNKVTTGTIVTHEEDNKIYYLKILMQTDEALMSLAVNDRKNLLISNFVKYVGNNQDAIASYATKTDNIVVNTLMAILGEKVEVNGGIFGGNNDEVVAVYNHSTNMRLGPQTAAMVSAKAEADRDFLEEVGKHLVAFAGKINTLEQLQQSYWYTDNEITVESKLKEHNTEITNFLIVNINKQDIVCNK